MGFSKSHSSSVALTMNLSTKLITAQFYTVFDDYSQPSQIQRQWLIQTIGGALCNADPLECSTSLMVTPIVIWLMNDWLQMKFRFDNNSSIEMQFNVQHWLIQITSDGEDNNNNLYHPQLLLAWLRGRMLVNHHLWQFLEHLLLVVWVFLVSLQHESQGPLHQEVHPSFRTINNNL